MVHPFTKMGCKKGFRFYSRVVTRYVLCILLDICKQNARVITHERLYDLTSATCSFAAVSCTWHGGSDKKSSHFLRFQSECCVSASVHVYLAYVLGYCHFACNVHTLSTRNRLTNNVLYDFPKNRNDDGSEIDSEVLSSVLFRMLSPAFVPYV